MAQSDYLKNKLLDHVYGGSDFTRPATVYFALFTTMPTGAGGGVEVTGGSYARVAVTNNGSNFPAASSQQKACAIDVVFPQATAHWGTVVGCAIFDASSGGNMLDFGELNVPVVVPVNAISRLNASDLIIALITCS